VDEESSRRVGPENPENLVELGFRRLEEGEPQEALRLADQAASLDENYVDAHEVRALALTLLGRIDEADGAFSRAAELDPKDYFRPFRLEGTAFDDTVEQTLLRLPPQFREFLENVEVGVEDTPSPELIAEGLEFDLLGVYIGETAGSDDWDFPGRVVLFQCHLENNSPDPETLLAEIRDTRLHEVGYHFGMDEDTLREIEDGDEA
jgi:predicted Zn-dependent protease with MMP-like domain